MTAPYVCPGPVTIGARLTVTVAPDDRAGDDHKLAAEASLSAWCKRPPISEDDDGCGWFHDLPAGVELTAEQLAALTALHAEHRTFGDEPGPIGEEHRQLEAEHAADLRAVYAP